MAQNFLNSVQTATILNITKNELQKEKNIFYILGDEDKKNEGCVILIYELTVSLQDGSCPLKTMLKHTLW